MEEVFDNPVQFSRGINLRDLMTSEAEFHIDLDFSKSGFLQNDDEDMFSDLNEEDSDNGDVLKTIEDSTDKMMLSSPEYQSFDQLAAKMVDCVPSGDVKMLIIEEGDGPLVSQDAEVKLHYAAYWEGARIPFDSSLTSNFGAPKTIRLGAGRLLAGLEIGLTSVKGPAAMFHLLLQPAATWGPKGVLPRIKPEPSLFVIVLYDCRDVQAAARFHSLPTTEQCKFEVTLETVKGLRADARVLFAKHKYKRAISNYQQALSVLAVSRPETPAEHDKLKELKIKMYVNLSVCYYKLEKPKYVILMCENIDRIIDLNTHCKGLFYYGRAHEMLGKVDEAIACYKKALKLEPRNKELGQTLAHLDVKNKKSIENEKGMWQKAMASEVVEKKVVYDVDEDFQNGVRDMCQELAGRDYAKFDLPNGLTKDEIVCLRDMVGQFAGLVLHEDGEGRKKRISITKKMLS